MFGAEESNMVDLTNVGFFGRAEEITTLKAAFLQLEENETNQIVTVGGLSGTGKSHLVETFHEQVASIERAFYCTGKCDDSRSMEPFSPLQDAFDHLCYNIQQHHTNETETKIMTDEIKIALGEEGNVLASIVGGLTGLLDLDGSYIQTDDSSEVLSRVLNLFRLLVRTITKTKPLVLFIDDLQWSDASTLQVLASLVTDPRLKRFMLIMAYRDNEVTLDHPFSKELEGIRHKGKKIIQIKLGDLSLADLNSMISAILRREPEDVMPLLTVVYEKTRGNIFFTLQYIRMLESKKLIRFSYANLRIEWADPHKIRSDTSISDNVLELVADRVTQLPNDAQSCLKLGSCVSSILAVKLVTELHIRTQKDLPAADVRSQLDLAHKEDLLVRINEMEFKFAHDRIRQACYSLISDGDKEQMHIAIGFAMLDIASEESETTKSKSRPNGMIFLAADQLHKGLCCLKGDEIIQFARANLKAGRTALEWAAFSAAVLYLNRGIQALKGVDDAWKDHHELQMSLHQGLAEASWSVGETTGLDQVVHEILVHAKTEEERIPAWEARGQALTVVNKPDEACKLDAQVLVRLGVFPKHFRTLSAIVRLKEVKKRLESVTTDDVLALSECDKPLIIAAMRMTSQLSKRASISGNKILQLLAMTTTVTLTLDHGYHKSVVACFATFGLLVSGVFGDAKEGHRLGELSKALADRLKVDDIVTVFVSTVNSWHEPLPDTLEPMFQAFSFGMRQGRVEMACYTFNYYLFHKFLCGLSLDNWLEEASSHAKVVKESDLPIIHSMLQVMRLGVLNIAGKNEDETESLGGCSMNEDTLLQSIGTRTANKDLALWHFHAWKMMVYFYYGRLDLADQNLTRARALKETIICFSEVSTLMTFEAFIPLALATRTGSRKYKSRARNSLKVVKRAISKEHKGMNLAHKLHLMEAELLALDKRQHPDNVRKSFDIAIRSSKRCGFRHDAALANQRAGEYCIRDGDNLRARDYLEEAVTLFKDWEATGIQSHLQFEHRIQIDGFRVGGKRSRSYIGRKRHSGINMADSNFDLASKDSQDLLFRRDSLKSAHLSFAEFTE